MRRVVIIKVYLDSIDKEKYLSIHSVTEWSKILKCSRNYAWEMLSGKKPISEKFYRKLLKYEKL